MSFSAKLKRGVINNLMRIYCINIFLCEHTLHYVVEPTLSDLQDKTFIDVVRQLTY